MEREERRGSYYNYGDYDYEMGIAIATAWRV